MDFASLMTAEISKTKDSSSATSTAEGATITSTTKKYLRRAEIESQRQEVYLEEQASLQRGREAKAHQKRKIEEEESTRARAREEKRRRLAHESRIRREEEEATKERARRKRLGLPDLPLSSSSTSSSNSKSKDGGAADGTEQEDIPDAELIALLRKLGEPAILFDESHRARLRRYRRLISPTTPRPTLSATPIPTTLSLLPAHLSLVPSTLPPLSERAYLYRQLASYFTTVLTEWGVALAQRDDKVKESFQGKAAEMAMNQSRENMRPLFRRFERGDVEEGILEPVVEIVRAAQERRYVDANDGYLMLSIGKAYVFPSFPPTPSSPPPG